MSNITGQHILHSLYLSAEQFAMQILQEFYTQQTLNFIDCSNNKSPTKGRKGRRTTTNGCRAIGYSCVCVMCVQSCLQSISSHLIRTPRKCVCVRTSTQHNGNTTGTKRKKRKFAHCIRCVQLYGAIK